MTKNEFISKYGEAAWEHHKLITRKWREQHKDQCKQLKKKCHEKHKEQYNQLSKKWCQDHRITGWTKYCKENYDLIENYSLAKADNFDPKKWHLHHRLENYWSHATLKRKGLYYNVNPEALIWLPYEEHKKDIHCKNSKWHKRSLENG